MSTRRVVGVLLIVLPFVGLFVIYGVRLGWGAAAAIWGGGALLAGVLLLGSWLTFGRGEGDR